LVGAAEAGDFNGELFGEVSGVGWGLFVQGKDLLAEFAVGGEVVAR